MKNNRTTALLMLLVFLLVVAVVIIFLTGLERNPSTDNPYENVTVTAEPEPSAEMPDATPTTAPTTVPTTAPVYYPPSTAAPVQTAAPVTTAAPSATAAPTPTPTPASVEEGGLLPAQELIPVVPGVNTGSGTDSGSGDSGNTIPTGTVIASGSFRSDTGTALNIHADWTASISNAQTVDIAVTVYADHYELYTTANPNILQISVDGQYVSLGSPAIDYNGLNGLAMTEINSRTFSVSLASGEIRTIPVEVVWQYRGTYSGVELSTIECGGNITVSR